MVVLEVEVEQQMELRLVQLRMVEVQVGLLQLELQELLLLEAVEEAVVLLAILEV